ncbi:carbohydrate-binding protein [Persicobacter psychrovividus]|uniref:carbohydrate-binding protein n=1 Tax=Persicobacter psychrovividus TaxID=387638 RepID=UPI0030CA3497
MAELLPYLSQDNVDVKLRAGIYDITVDNITNGEFTDYTTISGKKAFVLFLFSGNNSTYDFSGVTVNVATGVFNAYDGAYSDFFEVQTTGNNNIIKNLTLVDVGSVDDYPKNGACNIVMDGANNRIEGFHTTVKGSFPYGYGDAFGKGGSYTIKHYKHSACLIRGESNHLKDCSFTHRSYGHCVFMQAANNPKIEGCYIEGEVRKTDDMLAEEGTGSPADLIDFYTDWGYRLPAGYMLSTGEAGIRAYNAGATIIDGVEYSRGTSNVTVLDCTVKYMRTGVTIAHATGTKYVEGVTAIGCENGFSLGSGDVVDCYADCAYGPVYASTYESDRSYNAEITIIPAVDPYYNGSGSVAYIGGSQHKIVLKGENANLDEDLKIKIGGDKNNIRLLYGNLPHQNDFVGTNFEIINQTNYPIFLSDKSSKVTGKSAGMVTDLGEENTIEYEAVSTLTIEAEECSQSSGLTKVEANDNSEGYLTDVNADDWAEYQVNIPYAGSYLINYLIASDQDENQFSLLLEDRELTNEIFSRTAASDSWSSVQSSESFFLEKGVQTLKLLAQSDGWQINKMNLMLECAKVEIIPFAEKFNDIGKSLGKTQATEIIVFPGNTLKLSPEPSMGGSWSWNGPNGFVADTRIVELPDMVTEMSGDYKVTYTNDCGQKSMMTFTIQVNSSILIEAEDFSNANEGSKVEQTTDDHGEKQVVIEAEDAWIEYEVEVPIAAIYDIDVRWWSELEHMDFLLSIDEVSQGQFSFPATNQWTTSTIDHPIYLTEGTHKIRLLSKTKGWKLNWLSLMGKTFVNPCQLPFHDNGFEIKNKEVSWSTGVYDITCADQVNVYVTFEEVGETAEGDHLDVYYRLDEQAPIKITAEAGAGALAAIVKGVSGQTIELIIEGKSGSDHHYFQLAKVSIVRTTDPFAKIEAEHFDDADGVKIGACGDVGGGQNLGSIFPGNWSMYSGLDLTGVKSIDLRVASVYNDAYVEIHLDAPEGKLIGTGLANNTEGWQVYETISTPIEEVIGVHDVYLVYKTISSRNVVNINWFQFSDEEVTDSKNDQSINFESFNSPVLITDNDFVLQATSTSGLKVTFQSSDENVAVIEGEVVKIKGIGETTITAAQEGDLFYHPAAVVSQKLVINKLETIIDFTPIEVKKMGDSVFKPWVTTNSTSEIRLFSSDDNVAKVTDGRIHIEGVGEAIISAYCEENETYTAAKEDRLLIVEARVLNSELLALVESIYPNPVLGNLNIELNTPDKAFVEIIDIQGNKVHEEWISAKSSQIDVHHLNKGIYFLRLSTDTNITESYKLIFDTH